MDTESVVVIGRVIGLKGSVRAESGADVRELAINGPVYVQETVITGADGNVEIRFQDDTILSQGPSSTIELNEYVYNPDGPGSGLAFRMLEGTFRKVTGKIAEQNPESIQLESPLAVIGIRGTTTVHQVGQLGEQHGAEDIHGGHQVLIMDQFGELRVITLPQYIVDLFPGQPMSMIRPFTLDELEMFLRIAPEGIEFVRQLREVEQDGNDDGPAGAECGR
jgi:hypothetical protein